MHIEGWINRGNLNCPCCGNITDVKTIKKQFKLGVELRERLISSHIG